MIMECLLLPYLAQCHTCLWGTIAFQPLLQVSKVLIHWSDTVKPSGVQASKQNNKKDTQISYPIQTVVYLESLRNILLGTKVT